MRYAIQTLGLSKSYGTRPACQDISLGVREGALFGLLGPNGAGKSTLVKMLLGLTDPSSGTARLLGRPHQEPRVRQHIGYLPELFRYPEWLSAREVLAFHAELAGGPASPSQIDDLLNLVGLQDHRHQRVRAFSKGMQQRLGLATALVGRPELLFLDEPTSALDPLGRHQVAEILRTLHRAGVTIFLNSHLLRDLEGLCDTIGLLDHGRLVYTGSIHDVQALGSPRFRFVTGPLTASCQKALAAFAISPTDDGLLVAEPLERLPDIHRLLVRENIPVFLVERESTMSLEDWFVNTLTPSTPIC